MQNILIVEDNIKLNDGICLALQGSDYACIQVDSIQSARMELDKGQMDLILLDVNLPDGNGMDFLVEIRQSSMIPVILLTANNMEMDIVTGLELGANDYITKPFSLMVLRARIAVQLRGAEIGKIIRIDRFCFDFKRLKFMVGDRNIELSRTEQKLLSILIENRGITLNRNQLTDQLWSGESDYVEEHALTVVIKRLRDKLREKPDSKEYIKTVYGIGYVWDDKE